MRTRLRIGACLATVFAQAASQIASLPDDALPIICGGTHYFIQHFLFPPSEFSTRRPPGANGHIRDTSETLDGRWKPPCPRPPIRDDLDPELAKLLDSFWTSQPAWPGDENEAGPSTTRPGPTSSHQLLSLYRLLEALDAREASRWHWRDGRKVKRGLERWWERGPGHASGEDAEVDDVKPRGRHARFRTLIFWVYEPLETLRPRLDRRIGRMVEVSPVDQPH